MSKLNATQKKEVLKSEFGLEVMKLALNPKYKDLTPSMEIEVYAELIRNLACELSKEALNDSDS